ncbi:MAG: hypothetical protein EBR26_00305 [Microbacteriaceae bacterium]|nr:hypothetical protein [Microbacteriaceae bacterium]
MAEVENAQGLSSAEAKLRLTKYGPNAVSARSITWYSVLFRQFRSPILLLLIVAAAISGLLANSAIQ